MKYTIRLAILKGGAEEMDWRDYLIIILIIVIIFLLLEGFRVINFVPGLGETGIT